MRLTLHVFIWVLARLLNFSKSDTHDPYFFPLFEYWPLFFIPLYFIMRVFEIEGQNVRNFPYPVRIRWSRQPNLVPFYLYNRIFECPENIRNDGFPDVLWLSTINSNTLLWIQMTNANFFLETFIFFCFFHKNSLIKERSGENCEIRGRWNGLGVATSGCKTMLLRWEKVKHLQNFCCG